MVAADDKVGTSLDQSTSAAFPGLGMPSSSSLQALERDKSPMETNWKKKPIEMGQSI